MKEIKITQGKTVIVDDQDFEMLMRHKWLVKKGLNTVYAARWETINGKRNIIQMHREILGLTKGDGIMGDHRNQNGLDNRRFNLRRASKSLNGYNCKTYNNNPSGYRGVTKRKNKWRSAIRINGKLRHLGTFADSKDAAMAYDAAVIIHRVKNSPLNFPLEAL